MITITDTDLEERRDGKERQISPARQIEGENEMP